MPQEPFCEYELWVDENAPFDHTMVFGYKMGQWGMSLRACLKKKKVVRTVDVYVYSLEQLILNQ